MRNLFLFLYRYRAFIIFLALELGCAYLIVQNNKYQKAAFFNSSNVMAAKILVFSNSVSDYFSLKDQNQALVEENAQLQRLVVQLMDQQPVDSALSVPQLSRYDFIAAKVINNSTRHFNNYLTINQGSAAGIKIGMGVISAEGVVGKVKAVSNNFATITSFLHSNNYISVKLARTDNLASIQWGGRDPKTAELQFLPRHVALQKGDTVVTSGFDELYPERIPLGVVTEFNKNDSQPFYDGKVELFSDYSTLSYVYVIRERLKPELDSLNNIINVEYE